MQGVLGPLPAVVGALQALEVLKICSASFEPFADKLLQVDGKSLEFHTIHLRQDRRRTCDLCGEAPTIRSLRDTTNFCRDYGLIDCKVGLPASLHKSISCEEYSTKLMHTRKL